MKKLRTNWLTFLSESDIAAIDAGSRKILTEVGIRLEDTELKNKLLDQGCGNEKNKVQFTPEIIEQTLAGLASELTFQGRNKEKVSIREGFVGSHTGASIPYIYDMETGQKRDAVLRDLEQMICLMNELDNLTMPGAVVLPADVPHQTGELVQAATMMRYSHKPLSGSAISTAAQARYVAELYTAMEGALPDIAEYPLFAVGVSPESPLYFPEEITGVMKAIISKNIPTLALVAPLVGFTAPITISGGLTQMNACILAYTILSRQINPKTPVIYGARLAPVNMKNAHSIWGVPEIGLIGACSVQLARHYGFLSDVYGYSSTSCAHDPQYGAETAINGLLPMLAGANLISGFGSFGSGYMSSFEDLVINDEIFGMHLRVVQGIAVDEDRIAVDVIAEAMHGTPYYLQGHTMKYLRSGELFTPQIGLHDLVQQWEKDGRPDMTDNARKRARSLLQRAVHEPLPDAVEKEFTRILKAADKELLS